MASSAPATLRFRPELPHLVHVVGDTGHSERERTDRSDLVPCLEASAIGVFDEQAECLVEIGRREQHRKPLVLHELRHDLPQFAPRKRIDADRRFIEDE